MSIFSKPVPLVPWSCFCIPACLARANGAITEVEHLARRAQVLQMAVGDHITQRRMHVRPDDRAVAPLSPDDAARVLLEEE